MRTIIVNGEKTFTLTLDENCSLTFGPFSPPNGKDSRYENASGLSKLKGTLRVYRGKTATANNILAVYSGVESFRDMSIGYSESHDLPICTMCKSNLSDPGDELCSSCNGNNVTSYNVFPPNFGSAKF